MAEKLCIGIASYGDQAPEFWEPLVFLTGSLHRYDIDFTGLLVARSMSTDGNRNRIVDMFKKNKAEYILWIDTDNVIPLGGVRRLLDAKKDIISGLYYQKAEPYIPVAFNRIENNRYIPIADWNRGEILPIDMAGMGATLVHRSVYFRIEDEMRVVQRWDGGITTVHKDDIDGKIHDKLKNLTPKLCEGSLREEVIHPDHKIDAWPHYRLEYGRTEDVVFFENARRCGFQPFVDTSVEVDHIYRTKITGKTYRDCIREKQTKIPMTTEYVLVDEMEATSE